MTSGGADIEGEAAAAAGERHLCLNCGTVLLDAYCQRCGQHAHVHRTLGAFWHDLSHSVLHFEGKVWRTLPLLAWRPGELTRLYAEGQRARFVSPIAMFLFSVFLMFAIFNSLGAYAFRDRDAKAAPGTVDSGRVRADSVAELEQDFKGERAENVSELSDLAAAREKVLARGGDTAPIDADVAAIRAEMATDQRHFAEVVALEQAEERRRIAHKQPIAGVAVHAGGPSVFGWLDEGYQRAKRNPKLLAYKLQSSAYKFSWALIPITAPFMWLLFLHRARYRRYRLYDHFVFVTYSLAFMSLWAVFYTFLKVGGMLGPPALIPFLIPPIHLYRQLRGAYALGRWSALWRTVAMMIFAFIAGGLFFMLLLTVGVLG
jgi:hypothetical protein